MDIFESVHIWSQVVNAILAIIIRNMKAHVKNHFSPTKSFSVRNRKQDIKALINTMKSKITYNLGPTKTCC